MYLRQVICKFSDPGINYKREIQPGGGGQIAKELEVESPTVHGFFPSFEVFILLVSFTCKRGKERCQGWTV